MMVVCGVTKKKLGPAMLVASIDISQHVTGLTPKSRFPSDTFYFPPIFCIESLLMTLLQRIKVSCVSVYTEHSVTFFIWCGKYLKNM